MACVCEGEEGRVGRGEEKERGEKWREALLMQAHTHNGRGSFTGAFLHGAFRTTKRFLVKHESFAPVSEIISISVDSNLVKVKDS